jgi:hypothetical protein
MNKRRRERDDANGIKSSIDTISVANLTAGPSQQVPQPYQSYRTSSTSYSNHPTTLPPISVHSNHPPPPQIGLLGATSAHEREKKRKGGPGASMMGRRLKRRLTEERQRKPDGFQQQRPQMAQNGSTYRPVIDSWSSMYVAPSESRGGALQDSDLHEGNHNSSTPSRQGLARSQVQRTDHQATAHRLGKSGDANGKGLKKARQDGWAGSSLAPVDTVKASASESGTPSAPPSPSYAEN